MDSRARMVGQVVTAFVTAASLLADFNAVSVGGRALPWQAVAVVSFLVFVFLVVWQQWEMHSDLHRPERLVTVVATGEPDIGDPYSWRRIDVHPDSERIYLISASVRIVLRNRDERRRLVTDLFLEVHTARRRFWPFTRLVATCDPNIIDNREGGLNSTQPRRVNWVVEPESDEIVHVVDFDRWWDRGSPSAPKHVRRWDMRLVAEYGGSDRQRRVRIGRPPITPLPPVLATASAEAHSLETSPPELVQFVKAWLMPAWEKALAVLIPIRGEVKRVHGDRIEALLQLGVIDTADPTRRAVRDRIAGERDEPLDALVAAMYAKYELIVRWIDEAGDMVGQPFADSRRFREWQGDDRKLQDRLREFVALPAMASSSLAAIYRQTEEGGIGKVVRERLGSRPTSGREGGVG